MDENQVLVDDNGIVQAINPNDEEDFKWVFQSIAVGMAYFCYAIMPFFFANSHVNQVGDSRSGFLWFVYIGMIGVELIASHYNETYTKLAWHRDDIFVAAEDIVFQLPKRALASLVWHMTVLITWLIAIASTSDWICIDNIDDIKVIKMQVYINWLFAVFIATPFNIAYVCYRRAGVSAMRRRVDAANRIMAARQLEHLDEHDLTEIRNAYIAEKQAYVYFLISEPFHIYGNALVSISVNFLSLVVPLNYRGSKAVSCSICDEQLKVGSVACLIPPIPHRLISHMTCAAKSIYASDNDLEFFDTYILAVRDLISLQ